MEVSTVILFGKHPAWSDHMFVSNDLAEGHYLKRVFYDHSVIPALQGGQGDQRISENWSFLIFVRGQMFFIVNAVSRDSVGRRRFPLIVAYPLPQELRLESALDELKELKKELLSLLNEMLEPPLEDLNKWQETVTHKAKSFQSKVDWQSVGSRPEQCQLKRDVAMSLMSRLANDSDTLDLKSRSFLESYSLLKLGLKQFKSPPPAMLILDQEERGLGLFFAMKDGSSFHLKRHLYGNLTSLSVAEDNISPKVVRLLKSTSEKGEDVLLVDETPSLKLHVHHGPAGKKILIVVVLLALVTLLLFGIFKSCSGSGSEEDNASESGSTHLSARQKWIINATDYVTWIQPLIAFVDEPTTSLDGFDSVRKALKNNLDPFAVVKGGKADLNRAQNPPYDFFDPIYSLKLDAVYSDIAQLRASLTAYYKKQFSNDLLKELKRQNYPQPSFVSVDFSEQPLLPDFGPGLVEQLKSYTDSRNALNEVVVSTKSFWDAIIRPLHELCPEHAKYVQRYVQDLLAGSTSQQQFQGQFAALLKIFGHPEFIQLDMLNVNELSKNAEWTNLLEQEKSVESINKLVELLKANQKKEPLKQTLDETNKSPDTISKPSAYDHKKKPVDAPEETVNMIDKSISKKTLLLDSDSVEWNFFLDSKSSQLQDSRLFSEVKKHAEAMRQQILGDKTLENAGAIQKIQDQTNALVTALARLDVNSIKDLSAVHSAYLKNAENKKYLSDYIYAEYTKAAIDSGNVELVDHVSREINTKVNKYLAGLDKIFADLKAAYFSNNTGTTDAKLTAQLNQITQNPLYVDGILGPHFKIISTAVLEKKIPAETPQDLIWYANNLIEKDGVSEERLTAIAQAYNTLNSANNTGELNDAVREAFDEYVRNLSAENPEELLRVYQDLTIFLPQRLQTQRDKASQQIVAYWSQIVSSQDFEMPTRQELEQLENSVESPLLKEFYAGLLAEYGKTTLQSSGDALDEIRKVSGVKSISTGGDSQSYVEITFDGCSEKIIFLPVKTANGGFLAQQKPLSLQQYIELSGICNFDTEYYLTLQDSFWPRSFEVGMSLGFSTLSQWQFRNKDVFAPLEAFDKNTIPAHLNEPAQALRMANFFGLRLLKPMECSALVRLAESADVGRLEFSATDRGKLESSNTVQASVYAESIADSIKQNTWTGGIDFERGEPQKNQFFDVVGGSAELAYDGMDFYVCGGSWLFQPSMPEKPVKIAEPKRMYNDLGIRFAMDTPTKSFHAVVKETALRILTGNK